jgi:hypothetical protein
VAARSSGTATVAKEKARAAPHQRGKGIGPGDHRVLSGGRHASHADKGVAVGAGHTDVATPGPGCIDGYLIGGRGGNGMILRAMAPYPPT